MCTSGNPSVPLGTSGVSAMSARVCQLPVTCLAGHGCQPPVSGRRRSALDDANSPREPGAAAVARSGLPAWPAAAWRARSASTVGVQSRVDAGAAGLGIDGGKHADHAAAASRAHGALRAAAEPWAVGPSSADAMTRESARETPRASSQGCTVSEGSHREPTSSGLAT